MAFVKPDEDIKIGRKDISVTMFVVILNLAKYGKIRLSARGTNTFTAERITSLLTRVGIKEIGREDIIEDDQPTLKISLSCKDLNPLKTKSSKSPSQVG